MIKIKEVGSLILCSTSSGGTINKNRVDLGTVLGSSGGHRGPLEGPRAPKMLPIFSERPWSVLGGPWGGFGGLGRSLGQSREVDILIFLWFQMVF